MPAVGIVITNISRTPLKSWAQGSSLFTSCATNQRGCSECQRRQSCF